MVVGLDGIEKLILAIDPESLQEKVFKCVGYKNEGTFKQGNLVEMYRVSNPTEKDRAYTINSLYNSSFNANYEVKVFVKSETIRKPMYKGLGGV